MQNVKRLEANVIKFSFQMNEKLNADGMKGVYRSAYLRLYSRYCPSGVKYEGGHAKKRGCFLEQSL